MGECQRLVVLVSSRTMLTPTLGKPKKVLRVLDVKKGELCWIMGTVYMEMPLKPNILEDIGKDVRLSLILTNSQIVIPHSLIP